MCADVPTSVLPGRCPAGPASRCTYVQPQGVLEIKPLLSLRVRTSVASSPVCLFAVRLSVWYGGGVDQQQVEVGVAGCAYPGCPRPAAVSLPGRPAHRYCEQPDPETGRVHDRKSAYERSYQLARSGGDTQLAAARARAQEAAERPRPVSLAGVRLRDVAEQLIAALREAAGDSDARVSALLAALSGVEDVEAMEAELAAVRAEALAREAELDARRARAEAELVSERRRADDAGRAAEAAEELAGALRGQLTGLEDAQAALAGELAAARAEAAEATRLGQARQARLDELDAALTARTAERDELEGQTAGLRRERDELRPAVAAAQARATAAEIRVGELDRDLAQARAAGAAAEHNAERAERLAAARDEQARQAADAQRAAERRAEAAERAAERAEDRAEAAERRAEQARADTATVRDRAEQTGRDLAAAQARLDELRRRTAADDEPARARESAGEPTRGPGAVEQEQAGQRPAGRRPRTKPRPAP